MGSLEILIIAFAFLLIGGLITLGIMYMLTLQNTLKAVSENNRTMPPGQVWLILIPLFGIVWHFIVVNRIADSLKAEFNSRGISVSSDRPGAQIGIAHCVLNLCGIIPFIGGLAGLAGLVCWIIYWVKIKNYKNQLLSTQTNF